jgi:hypothetical protein
MKQASKIESAVGINLQLVLVQSIESYHSMRQKEVEIDHQNEEEHSKD